EAAEATPESVPLRLRTARLLIVDDNASTRRILSAHAFRWGMATREAANSTQAIELLRGDEAFDLILIDAALGTDSGTMLASDIRTMMPGMETPILIMWPFGNRPEPIGGIAACLSKP